MLCTLAAISYIITFLIYIHYIITSLVFCPSPFFFCVHVCGRVLFCYCCCCCSLVHSVNCLWIFNTTLLPSQQSLFDVVVVIVVIVRHTFLGGREMGDALLAIQNCTVYSKRQHRRMAMESRSKAYWKILHSLKPYNCSQSREKKVWNFPLNWLESLWFSQLSNSQKWKKLCFLLLVIFFCLLWHANELKCLRCENIYQSMLRSSSHFAHSLVLCRMFVESVAKPLHSCHLNCLAHTMLTWYCLRSKWISDIIRNITIGVEYCMQCQYMKIFNRIRAPYCLYCNDSIQCALWFGFGCMLALGKSVNWKCLTSGTSWRERWKNICTQSHLSKWNGIELSKAAFFKFQQCHSLSKLLCCNVPMTIWQLGVAILVPLNGN